MTLCLYFILSLEKNNRNAKLQVQPCSRPRQKFGLINTIFHLNLAVTFLLGLAFSASAQAPFEETSFVSPEIITGTDGTTFTQFEYLGIETQMMRDNRRGRNAQDLWKRQRAHKFEAKFTENLSIPVFVSADFGDSQTAERVAQPYLLIFGQVPTVLKVGVDSIMIQPGNAFWAGGQRRTILFHHDRFDSYYASGHAEELIFHEATHASLEPGRWDSADWIDAQNRDRGYISEYAETYPKREDFAESFLMYYAARIKSDRISSRVKSVIEATIPNRLRYFQSLVPPQIAGFYSVN